MHQNYDPDEDVVDDYDDPFENDPEYLAWCEAEEGPERDECPNHGDQDVVRHSVTRGADPYDIEILACGCGLVWFGPPADGPPAVIDDARRKHPAIY